MSVPNRLRCLLRPSTTATTVSIPQRLAPATVFVAPFSSTSAVLAKLRKAGSLPWQGQGRRGRPISAPAGRCSSANSRRTKTADRGKPPAPGERKAYRKRVLLSNSNALPVEGLEQPTAQAAMLDPAHDGTLLTLPNELIDQLRAVEALKPTQTWNMFRQPTVLQRTQTRELAEKMQAAASKGDTLRMVISGDKLAGKSTLLLQGMSYAYLNNWIVLNVPDGMLSPRHT